jgi:hypothetical protein
MSSGQVPLWVPVVVGLLGLVGVLGAQVVAGRREDRRWRRDTEREEVRWKRERERERDARSYEGRAQAYAEVIGAIEAFDWVLYQARQVVRSGQKLSDELATDVRRVTSQARNALGGVNVYAPERIRAMLRESMLRRSSLSIALLANEHGETQQRMWHDGQQEYRIMRNAMRRDLGLDAEDDAVSVAP